MQLDQQLELGSRLLQLHGLTSSMQPCPIQGFLSYGLMTMAGIVQ